MTEWQTIETAPDNQPVMTKIEDEKGERNVQALTRHGNLWWFTDEKMYVYYRPTHWRPVVGDHLVNGQFQSDKYSWCRPGFVPLKITDPMAQPLLWEYARLRRQVDEQFADDLQEALRLAGYRHHAF